MAATLQNVYDRSRGLTRTNSNSWPNSGSAGTDLISITNLTYLDIMRTLAWNKIPVTGVVANTTLVVGQEDYGVPDDMLEFVHIEVNYKDVTDYKQWIRMTEVDIANLPIVFKRYINELANQFPQYFQFGGQLYFAPFQGNLNSTSAGTQQAAGIRLWYIKRNANFVGTTPSSENVPWPLHFYEEVMEYGNAYRYFIPLDETEAAKYKKLYEDGMADMIANLKIDQVENVITTPIDTTNRGWM